MYAFVKLYIFMLVAGIFTLDAYTFMLAASIFMFVAWIIHAHCISKKRTIQIKDSKQNDENQQNKEVLVFAHEELITVGK